MEADTAGRALVVFSLDGGRFALDLDRVRRSILAVAITPLPGAPAIVLGIVDIGGVVIPVIDMRRRFGLPPREPRLSDHLLIAETGRRRVALRVDGTTGVLEVPGGSFAAASGTLPGLGLVLGAVKLADGLILIHDLDRLLSFEEDRAIEDALEAVEAPRGSEEKRGGQASPS